MASPLSILKTVLNLNHNRMHITSCETTTVTVHRFGETFEQTRIYVHARPYERIQKLCPVCRKNALGTILSTAQNPPGALRILVVSLFIFATSPIGLYALNTVYGRNISPGQMAEAASLRTSAMKSPGWSVRCLKQRLPCLKTLTGGQLETVSRQPTTA